MNRIILIGNGFDLAHGLPTRYNDFIKSYWEEWVDKLTSCDNYIEKDELCTFRIQNKNQFWRNIILYYRFNYYNYSNLDILKSINANTEYDIYKTKFLESLGSPFLYNLWVDIEEKYYTILKNILKKERHISIYTNPQQLNKELDVLKNKLITYLKTIQKEMLTENLYKSHINSIIYEPFKLKDISIGGWPKFEQFLKSGINYSQIKETLLDYNLTSGLSNEIMNHIEEYIKSLEGFKKPFSSDVYDFSQHFNNIKKGYDITKFFLLPKQILLLNFNYTKTIELYHTKNHRFSTNYIHGELENENNPVIFGYGDELDDDYPQIAKLNNNDYLKNIKSIRYLETDNYKTLLSFIASAPYQIYIMGHSCGISDRTLLNTLFEHENCISIKPYYYQKADGTDNYIEIVQNISRNFNDKKLMRDRVVNKTYCEPFSWEKN